VTFANRLFQVYSRAARDICGEVVDWIRQNWKSLISEGFLTNPSSFMEAVTAAQEFWHGHNLFIADLLEHVRTVHLERCPRAVQREDVVAGIEAAFLESLNLFVAVRVDYTIRVVFCTQEDPATFDVNCFPFLRYTEHSELKCAAMRRVMQLAFADGSYAVDLDTPGMSGVIGGCYLNNKYYVENNVADSTGEFRTRTPRTDLDLGIGSIAYFPAGSEDQQTADAVIGVYSPIMGAFRAGVDTDVVRALRHRLVAVGAMVQFADVLESGIKELMRGIVFQTVAQVVEVSPYRDAGIKTLSSMLRQANQGTGALSAFDQQFCDEFGERLRSYIGHHGETLLPFVRKAKEGDLPREEFDLVHWFQNVAPARVAQAFSVLRNFFSTSETLATDAVKVVGNQEVLCAVFHAVVHNARQRHGRELPARPELELSIEGPNPELRYGIVRLRSPGTYDDVPAGLSLAQYATVLRQGIPLPTSEGRGFGLFWSRCLLEAAGGRLHVGRLRSAGLLSSRAAISEMRHRIAAGQAVDEVISDYRKGLEVAICLKLVG
jgi:hypothetical protein